jgi:hypothetical protein
MLKVVKVRLYPNIDHSINYLVHLVHLVGGGTMRLLARLRHIKKLVKDLMS